MIDPRDELTAAALAYLGDSVIEILARERLVREGLSSSASLNAAAARYVRATSQSAAAERVLPKLTEREAAAYRRGRNIGHTNTPRSATPAEYRRATGLEALFGWLWLGGEEGASRARELFCAAYDDSPKAETQETSKE